MTKSIVTSFTALAASFVLSGCLTMAPDNERPQVAIEKNFGQQPEAPHASLTLEAWQDFFPDDNARRVIQEALQSNTDLRIALARMSEVEGRYQIQREALFPSVQSEVSQTRTKNSANVFTIPGVDSIQDVYSASVGLTSYELDLFGRVRSLSDSALAQYLSSTEAARSVRLSVISQTANAYYSWVSANRSLNLAEKTLHSRQESLDLIQKRLDTGIASELDLAQAQASLATVRAQKAQFERAHAAAKSALELLIGKPLSQVRLDQQQLQLNEMALDLPDSISSEVLLSRPDVLSAEQSLYAANANIGAARAAFFPSISITGQYGYSSTEFDNLFDSESNTWSFIPSIRIPIFNNGLQANLDIAQAQQERLIAEYEKAVQQAFAEVYQLMTNRTTYSGELEANRSLVKAQSKRLKLAEAKYKAGLASYLEVLNAQQDKFTAEQALLETERAQLANVISLYKALGGGDKAVVLSQQPHNDEPQGDSEGSSGETE
ncbi:efflux transporter outer membrane subunit [Kangiella sediminilitoris]|uniref:RND efflux system, outer membrane lipoprotein, NodT family n=1 Tax=Kangiella sediminilitoris TaxID=1144748 RepID=A0A1B3B8D1_9GAMM|nr:efflux transporter outer membrane subunit [Kangiella sediminilitoris]AOE49062.1 RND efflux system, outer membrane lipoprotein, NodT family [Kangiella sediminilitoris]